jgi:membrane protease YdiL (CAAX protease family)
MQNPTAADLAVLALELIPAVVFGLAGERVAQAAERWPRALRLALPVICALPYVLISASHQMFSWKWMVLYTVLPIAVAWLLEAAATSDPEQRGNWRDAIVLLVLGLAVDLRWFEPAWPASLTGLGKLLLVDAGLYGYVVLRRLRGTGFDFHFRWSDWKSGLRELLLFAPIVIALGIALRFLHPHAHTLHLSIFPPPPLLATWVYIFVFVAVPEELFFRAWVQNLLESRFTPRLGPQTGRRVALIVTSILFGLSHFNKRSAHFNWTYVLLASIAGIFYGRAWRENRRVPASAITHASVDTIWSLWF